MELSDLVLVRSDDADIAERLLRRSVWAESGCLIWTGALSGRGRYGTISVRKWQRPDRMTHQFRTHRVAYGLFVGPIPAGMELDHICHTASGCDLGSECPHRACLNPAHLRPVTHTENVLTGTSPSAQHAVKTHCPKGHPLAGDNLYVIPSTGGRMCRTCRAVNRRAWKLANPESVRASNRAWRQKRAAEQEGMKTRG